MKYERSAGTVSFTQVDGELRYVIIRNRGGYYGFPKGHIEEGESEMEAALRETREEVGLRVTPIPDFSATDEYKLPGKKGVRKTVIYFAARYEGQEIVPLLSELTEASLMTYSEAMASFTHEGNRRILAEADAFIRGYLAGKRMAFEGRPDPFLRYLEEGDDPWRTRALTDASCHRDGVRLPIEEVNTELATYGDALLKFTLCELFLDRVNKLSAVKQNYESDVALVKVAERYDLLRYLHFNRADRRIPQDYDVRPVPLDCPAEEERRLRADNERHKYIATAVEALLGAMFHAHADMDEIRATVRSFVEYMGKPPRKNSRTRRN